MPPGEQPNPFNRGRGAKPASQSASRPVNSIPASSNSPRNRANQRSGSARNLNTLPESPNHSPSQIPGLESGRIKNSQRGKDSPFVERRENGWARKNTVHPTATTAIRTASAGGKKDGFPAAPYAEGDWVEFCLAGGFAADGASWTPRAWSVFFCWNCLML